MTLVMIALAAQAAAATMNPQGAVFADMPKVAVAYYDVEGRDRDAIRKSMNRLRPTDTSDGSRVDAKTSWRYQWRLPGGPGGCDLARAEVTYTIDVLLPRAADYDRLSRRERERWDGYLTRLSAHERNHAIIATRGAAELERAIRSAPSCEAARPAAQKVVEAVGAASREYDRKTRHGAAEGVTY